MNSVIGFIRFFQSGGVFMFPLLFILAIGTAIVVERFLVLMRSKVNGPKFWNRLSPILLSNQLDEGHRFCSGSKFRAPLHHVMAEGIKGMRKSQNRENLQGTLDEAMMAVAPRLEARLHYLPNLANVATLLGLLGTIIGLIEAFTAVAVADPSQKAALLAKGISMAMNTTAFGLVVAIPMILIYTFLQSRTNRIIDTIDEYALKLLNLSGQLSQENEEETIRVGNRRNSDTNGNNRQQDSRKEMASAKGKAHVE